MRMLQVAVLLVVGGAVAWAQPRPQPQQPRPQPQGVPQGDPQQQQMQQVRQRFEQQQQRMEQLETRLRELQQRAGRPQPVGPARREGRVQPAGPARPPVERALGVPGGRWWDRPEMVERLSLAPEQQRKLDEVFQQSRLKLIDLNAAAQKEEAVLEPLVRAEEPDEAKLVAQMGRLAQARAEVEAANVRMLLGIRRVLTPEQRNRLRGEPVNPPVNRPPNSQPAPPAKPPANRPAAPGGE